MLKPVKDCNYLSAAFPEESVTFAFFTFIRF